MPQTPGMPLANIYMGNKITGPIAPLTNKIIKQDGFQESQSRWNEYWVATTMYKEKWGPLAAPDPLRIPP